MTHDQTSWSSQWTNGVSARSVLHTCTEHCSWSTDLKVVNCGDWLSCRLLPDWLVALLACPWKKGQHGIIVLHVYILLHCLAHDHPTRTVCDPGSVHLHNFGPRIEAHDGPACQMSCRNSNRKLKTKRILIGSVSRSSSSIVQDTFLKCTASGPTCTAAPFTEIFLYRKKQREKISEK